MHAYKRMMTAILALFVFMCVCGPSAAAEPVIMLSTDIIIDVGHGGIDGGTSYGNLLEKDINLQIAKKLYAQLIDQHYKVVLNRTGDYALSDENRWLNSSSRHRRDLAQRKQLSHEVPAKLLLSLHVNWSKSKSESGPIVIYQSGSNSVVLARLLQKSLNEYYQTKQLIVKAKTFYLLKHVRCPAVIIEMGFISNAGDRRKLTSPESQKEIARAVTRAVNEYFILFKP